MEKLTKQDYKLNPNKNGLAQTDRNKLKKEMNEFLKERLEAIFPDSDVVIVPEGIAVATLNETLDETITFVVDTTFKNFDYNALVESEQYAQQLADKAKENEAKAKAKAIKIAKDKAEREAKAKAKATKGE